MWFREISKDSDVVISTRIRYARSIDGYNFPNNMSKSKKEEILDKIAKAINKKEYNFFKTESIDKTTLLSLVEQRLISKELVNMNSTGIITNKDSSIVAMVNEEDHLRIQSFKSGFDIYSLINNFSSFFILLIILSKDFIIFGYSVLVLLLLYSSLFSSFIIQALSEENL